jgi:hypothetical protein
MHQCDIPAHKSRATSFHGDSDQQPMPLDDAHKLLSTNDLQQDHGVTSIAG